MFRTGRSTIAVAMALGASLAIAQVAEAGPYANNKCIGKKQGALAKYTSAVAKAWDQNPMDSVARDAAIAAALTKLTVTFGKEETKANDKNADCTASSTTFTTLVEAIDDTIETLAVGAQDYGAAAGYVAGAMKARGKHIKYPVKDPGKVKQEAGRTKASEKYLTDANMTVTTAATELENTLYVGTTQAPLYPQAFQSIVPANEVVYGKETLTPRCVDNDPYMFWARKGTTNNVLMYYQGGGACWNNASCYSVPGTPPGTCKRTATLNDNPDLAGTGFADYDNPNNPFADWSVVFVSYCTCDVHWGENTENYGGGNIGRHYGRINAAVAEKFAREHFVDPDKVFVTGSSAGSYGAIMNSYWLMKEVWPNADFAVLGDAGVGVITQDFISSYFDQAWNVSANFPTDLPGVTPPIDNLSLVDLIDGLSQRFPNARFANYDASYDGGGGSQCNFYQVMNNPSPPGNFITEWGNWWEGACEWNRCMRDFKQENAERSDNYHLFNGAGTRHTMFGSDKVYTEVKSTNAAGTGVTIADWVQAMIDDTAGFEDVDCNHLNGDCNLTDSCQGGTNAGGLCNSNADCTTGATCTGGTTPGIPCTVNADCSGAGGFCPYCQRDPDTGNAPFNNDNTVNCGPTVCPCGPAANRCGGEANQGLACTTDDDCPGSSCQHVKCPTFTP